MGPACSSPPATQATLVDVSSALVKETAHSKGHTFSTLSFTLEKQTVTPTGLKQDSGPSEYSYVKIRKKQICLVTFAFLVGKFMVCQAEPSFLKILHSKAFSSLCPLNHEPVVNRTR